MVFLRVPIIATIVRSEVAIIATIVRSEVPIIAIIVRSEVAIIATIVKLLNFPCLQYIHKLYPNQEDTATKMR